MSVGKEAHGVEEGCCNGSFKGHSRYGDHHGSRPRASSSDWGNRTDMQVLLTAHVRAKENRVASKGKTLGWYVDTHYKLRVKKSAIRKKLADINEELEDLEGSALDKFGKEKLLGAKGKLATGFIIERDLPSVSDRKKLDRYIKRTGHTQLLSNYVNGEAYREITALIRGSKKSIPGIKVFSKVDFRTRKRS